MNSNPSLFGKIFIPSITKKIENCWLRLEGKKPYLEIPYNSFQNENWDLITGSFNGLDNVTFYKCYLDGGKGGSGGSYRKLHFSFMFENITFKDKSELIFSKVAFDSKSLDKWMLRSSKGLELKEHSGDFVLNIPKARVLHKVNTNRFSISIIQEYISVHSSKEASINRRTVITVTSKEAFHFDEINQLLVQIKRLILFFTHASPQIESYTFTLPDGKITKKKEYSRFNSNSGFSEGLEIEYREIKHQFDSVLRNWIKKRKLIEVIELIQEKYINTNLSFQNYFLNCCVAMESYHLRIVKSKVADEVKSSIKIRKEEREEISAIIDNEDLKESFLKRTVDWKKTTFKEKLSYFSEDMNLLKGSYISIPTDVFIEAIVKTRNKIAHEGEYLKYLTSFELFLFGKVLELIIKIGILKELGITDPKTVDVFYQDARNKVDLLAEINEYNQT